MQALDKARQGKARLGKARQGKAAWDGIDAYSGYIIDIASCHIVVIYRIFLHFVFKTSCLAFRSFVCILRISYPWVTFIVQWVWRSGIVESNG
jgi:hypothetical protein